jgi:pyrroline-5-carboxylate reductase
MQKTTTIGFIGAGNMAYALISGLINNGLEASNIKLSDTDTTLYH